MIEPAGDRQPGQTSTSDVAKRDLRAELLAAEAEATEKKRKAQGLPSVSVAAIENGIANQDEANKRRKLLQEAVDLDRDDDEDDKEKEQEEAETVKDDNDRYIITIGVSDYFA